MTAQTETILAHLTDIHFPHSPSPSLKELSFKRFFGLLNWHLSRKKMHLKKTLDAVTADLLQQSYHHLIISGDLVNLSLYDEYKAGLEWMEQFGSSSELSFVPGNHDYYGQTPFLYPETSTIPPENTLLDFMTSNERGAQLGGAFGPDLPFVRVVNDVAVIGLNSGVATPLFKAFGGINKKSLEALTEILIASKEAKLYRCVVLHHPPVPGITSLSRGLQNDHELQALLLDHGAELVLYGHNHEQHHERLLTTDGVCHVIGTPSASIGYDSHYELARYNLFSISSSPEGWVTKMYGRGLMQTYGDVKDLGLTELI